MKIVHIADFDYEFQSGIGDVVFNLSSKQRTIGHDVIIFSINSSFKEKENDDVFYVNNIVTFKNRINNIIPDIVIFHSVYKINYIFFSFFLKFRKIPYLIEPHGGSTSDNLNKSYLKKVVANFLIFNQFFKGASGIIYLNENEKDKSFLFKLNSVYCIIPNGIELNDEFIKIKSQNEKINFLFLARIDINHKGIDILFDSLELLSDQIDCNLFSVRFYGYGNEKDIDILKNRILKCNFDVKYNGPVWGYDKKCVFMQSDILMLTSRYEGMPIAVLEALSYGCPCLITTQTNMADVINIGKCGWVVNPNPLEISATLKNIILTYHEARHFLSKNAFETAKLFSWEEIANTSIVEYQKILYNNKAT